MSPRWEPDADIRRGRHVTLHLHAHLVFVTKYRKGIFDDAMLQRCEEIMREVCDKFEAELREFNGEADHVHLLVHYPSKLALSKLVNSLKGVSSRYLRAEYTDRVNRTGMDSVFWSRSYFAASCGGAPLSIVRQYIEEQRHPLP
ncbi:IS200/IS605 family transposase [Streptomyces sp. NPDC090021]|uniref:IS200/IS605 family transposase n=1 Tax=Streptomyces sp. NPDC090021 TaxID=3365919 RepID=UPI0037FD1545